MSKNDDAISRQAAIDAIDVKNVNKGIISALQSIIEELPSAEQWIPVTERLPEVDERVLTFGADDYGNTGIHISRLYGFSTEDKQYFLGYNGTLKVKAWMPLPEPYEEVGNGNNL